MKKVEERFTAAVSPGITGINDTTMLPEVLKTANKK
jgi:hypothetical protein